MTLLMIRIGNHDTPLTPCLVPLLNGFQCVGQSRSTPSTPYPGPRVCETEVPGVRMAARCDGVLCERAV